MNSTIQRVSSAARRVRLAIKIEPVARELYGVTDVCLDEAATLRRVALFSRGSGRATLSQEERHAALEIVRERFDAAHP